VAGGRERLSSEERRCRAEEQQQVEEARRRNIEADVLRRAEEEAHQHAEALRQRVREAERAFKEEKARFEQLRAEREQAERVESQQRTEAKVAFQERERKAHVIAFLKAEGFGGVNQPKQSLLRTVFPLHHAAETGNARMVELLLREGADPRLLNSWGQTAEQVAQSKGAGGPHAAVLEALRLSSAPCTPRADKGGTPRLGAGGEETGSKGGELAQQRQRGRGAQGGAQHREEDGHTPASSARAPHKGSGLDERPRSRGGAATAGGA